KEERAVRDLLRKRSQLVRQKTTNLLSIQNLYSRNTGSLISANRIKQLRSEQVEALFPNADLALPVKANLMLMRSLYKPRSQFLSEWLRSGSNRNPPIAICSR